MFIIQLLPSIFLFSYPETPKNAVAAAALDVTQVSEAYIFAQSFTFPLSMKADELQELLVILYQHKQALFP